MAVTPDTTISRQEVQKASAQLESMRRSLASWLHYRTINNQVAAGKLPSKMPVALARKVNVEDRDWLTEQKLADQLHILLREVMPDAQLPTPSIATNPDAAVELAQIALRGPAAPVTAAGPQAQGIVWLWPALIVGGLLLAVTTAIKSMADVAKEKERLKCVQSGACTDYGFWLKAGGVALLAYLAWHHLGGKEALRGVLARGK